MTNMTYVEAIKEALMEVERFRSAALAATKRLGGHDSTLFITGCKETAAMKRASLDLTRVLAELRKAR